MDEDLIFLETFDGNISFENLDMECLFQMLEKHVSQYLYEYKTNDGDTIKIQVSNANIPHLIGLSKGHHTGLPTYHASVIFESLKNTWGLEDLKKGDVGWFDEAKYKILGVIYLYQILHLIECDVYTTRYVKEIKLKQRLKRDNIYFVIFKANNGMNYTLELSPKKKSDTSVFIPRSIRVNDGNVAKYSKMNLTFESKKRITFKNKVKAVKWS